jgi:hypothetical protein
MREPDLRLLQAGEPTEPDRQAASLYDEEKKSLENARLQAEIDDLVQDRDQRKTYGNRLFWLVVVWLIVIGLILTMHGFSYVPFKLSVAVLTTLIGSTTASVLGLFAIVANYLFPKR